jgi:sirohydrochlorin ferrochelatase
MTDLVACAHGTADPRGRRVVHDLVREIARRRPGIRTSLGFVDVDHPVLSDVVARVVADSNDAVVVPLLLSAGYHVNVDVRRVCAATGAVPAAALGPDPLLADVLADRLGPLDEVDRIVLAAAGSSDERALRDCSTAARLLAERVGRPVRVGYLSGRGRGLAGAISGPGAVAVATYLLAPGFFADRARHIAREAGAVRCAPPVGPDPRVARLALGRFDEAACLGQGARRRLPTVSRQTSTE